MSRLLEQARYGETSLKDIKKMETRLKQRKIVFKDFQENGCEHDIGVYIGNVNENMPIHVCLFCEKKLDTEPKHIIEVPKEFQLREEAYIYIAQRRKRIRKALEENPDMKIEELITKTEN